MCRAGLRCIKETVLRNAFFFFFPPPWANHSPVNVKHDIKVVWHGFLIECAAKETCYCWLYLTPAVISPQWSTFPVSTEEAHDVMVGLSHFSGKRDILQFQLGEWSLCFQGSEWPQRWLWAVICYRPHITSWGLVSFNCIILLTCSWRSTVGLQYFPKQCVTSRKQERLQWVTAELWLVKGVSCAKLLRS